MGLPENEIEAYLSGIAEKNGFLYHKFTSPSRAGVPDRVLIGHGQTIFVELKAPGETPRPLQIETMRGINLHGGIAVVIDSKNAADKIIKIILDYETSDAGKSCAAIRMTMDGKTDSNLCIITDKNMRKNAKRKTRRPPIAAVIPKNIGGCVQKDD